MQEGPHVKDRDCFFCTSDENCYQKGLCSMQRSLLILIYKEFCFTFEMWLVDVTNTCVEAAAEGARYLETIDKSDSAWICLAAHHWREEEVFFPHFCKTHLELPLASRMTNGFLCTWIRSYCKSLWSTFVWTVVVWQRRRTDTLILKMCE